MHVVANVKIFIFITEQYLIFLCIYSFSIHLPKDTLVPCLDYCK